jgi:hypothetical protein
VVRPVVCAAVTLIAGGVVGAALEVRLGVVATAAAVPDACTAVVGSVPEVRLHVVRAAAVALMAGGVVGTLLCLRRTGAANRHHGDGRHC